VDKHAKYKRYARHTAQGWQEYMPTLEKEDESGPGWFVIGATFLFILFLLLKIAGGG